MKAHIGYLVYLLRHKWFVLLACRQLGVSWWRALTHDLSKFLPSEWSAYVHAFFCPNGSRRLPFGDSPEFDRAWNAHQKRNPHHWNFWLLIADGGSLKPLPMPDACIREMLADWVGTGLAFWGERDAAAWYRRNRDKLVLHPTTRAAVEQWLECEPEFFGS